MVVFWGATVSHVGIGGILFASGVLVFCSQSCGYWWNIICWWCLVFALSHVNICGISFAGGVWCSALSHVDIGGILFDGGVLGCYSQSCGHWWNIIC